MTRRQFSLICLFAQIGCNPARLNDERASVEAGRARKEIAKELRVGSPQSDVLNFLKRRAWLFDFDGFQRRFVGVVYRSPDRTHVVTAYIYLDEQEKMTHAEVEIAVKAL